MTEMPTRRNQPESCSLELILRNILNKNPIEVAVVFDYCVENVLTVEIGIRCGCLELLSCENTFLVQDAFSVHDHGY